MSRNAVMVTGASGGIGFACARDLLLAGFYVAASDIAEIPATLVNEKRCLPISFHVVSEVDCKTAVSEACKKFGGLSALIHFAGIHHTKTWTSLTARDFNRVLEVNVTGSFFDSSSGSATHVKKWRRHSPHRVCRSGIGRCRR